MDVAIVGGGLSGLTAAFTMLRNLEQENASQKLKSVSIYEAKEHLGGRTISTSEGLDLGGSWIFGGFLRTEKLCRDLNVGLMRHPGGGAQKRIVGGVHCLVNSLSGKIVNLAKKLNVDLKIRTDSKITVISSNKNDRMKTLEVQDGTKVNASHVLVSIPPRIAAQTIEWKPLLSEKLRTRMINQNTWMASMGKVAFTYSTPWWRTLPHGLTIDSLRPPPNGPIVQLMDASTGPQSSGEVYAIVGFLAPDIDKHEKCIEEATTQMRSLGDKFGFSDMPLKTDHKLWMDDNDVFQKVHGLPLDSHAYYEHPGNWDRKVGEELERKQIWLCGSETSPDHPGYIEGAIIAGTQAGETLISLLSDS